MTTTANKPVSEDSHYPATLLMVNGFPVKIKARPAATVDLRGSATTINRIVTSGSSGGNPLCGSAKSVIRRVFAPRADVTAGVASGSGRSSVSKHVTVERFRVRSVAGLRGGVLSGRGVGGGCKRGWSRVGGLANNGLISEGCFEREPLRIPFITFPRFEETCLRRKNLRLCQQKQASKKPHSCSPPSRSRLFPSHRLAASSPSTSVSSVSTITTTGNQGPANNELIPERYHSLRDAKTYAELRRILDRNGRYLSRAANIGGSQGQCNQWQLRQLRGSNNRTLVTRDDYDDGTKSTCSSSYWSEHNKQRGGGSGTAALLSAKQQQQQQQRVRKRERQLSREQCDDTALLRYVRKQQCVTQDSSSVAGSVVVTKD